MVELAVKFTLSGVTVMEGGSHVTFTTTREPRQQVTFSVDEDDARAYTQLKGQAFKLVLA